jgi:hypothetical protein
LQTNDVFPRIAPWIRDDTLISPSRDYPPYTVWEGDLSPGEVISSRSESRPIGGTIESDGQVIRFIPKVLVLTYENVHTITKDNPSGRGLGVLSFHYRDDPRARGDYEFGCRSTCPVCRTATKTLSRRAHPEA